RRHTRLVSDWSSDVCSSDLFLAYCLADRFGPRVCALQRGVGQDQRELLAPETACDVAAPDVALEQSGEPHQHLVAGCVTRGVVEIGRASCRERGDGARGDAA